LKSTTFFPFIFQALETFPMPGTLLFFSRRHVHLQSSKLLPAGIFRIHRSDNLLCSHTHFL
jgi:hypothetical protein